MVRVAIHSFACSVFIKWNNVTSLFFIEKGHFFADLPSNFFAADLQMVVRHLKHAVEDNLKHSFSNKPSTACLIAEEACVQASHADFQSALKPKLSPNDLPWILHMPSCAEGMWISLWKMGGKKREEDNDPMLVHVPYGARLFLRGDVSHGGVWGRPGNACFHMAFRHESTDLGDKLLCSDMASEKKKKHSKMTTLTMLYSQMLKKESR